MTLRPVLLPTFLGLLFAAACGPAAPIAPEQVATEIVQRERVVIDTRLPREFASGHMPGAINLQWDWDQLEGRARAYVPALDTPITLRATDRDEGRAASRALKNLGYSDVAVILGPVEHETLSLMTVAELEQRMAGDSGPIVIDVRTEREWRTGTIDGALLVEQDAAPALLDQLDPEAEYAVICEGGYRSSQLASLMVRRGFVRVHNVIDGMDAWRASH